MKNIYTPTKARQNLFALIKQANESKKPIHIEPTKDNEKGAVLISADDWDAVQETLFLANNGVLDQINKRKDDPEENFDDVWDNL